MNYYEATALKLLNQTEDEYISNLFRIMNNTESVRDVDDAYKCIKNYSLDLVKGYDLRELILREEDEDEAEE